MTLRRTAVLAAAVLAALAAGWWVAGGASLTGSAGQPAQAPSPGTFAATANLPGTRQSLTPGRQPAATSAEADVFLKDDLRFRFEAMLLEAGEATSPSALKMRLAALLSGHFVAGDRARALALLDRYVDYRVALGEIKGPADASDPRGLRVALEARQRLREKHFDSDEYSALFADEEELDRFTLARLEIERNPALTPAQQQAALRQAESGPARRIAMRSDARNIAMRPPSNWPGSTARKRTGKRDSTPMPMPEKTVPAPPSSNNFKGNYSRPKNSCALKPLW